MVKFKKPTRRTTIIAAALIVGIVGLFIWRVSDSIKNTANTAGTTPSFNAVLPSGSSIEDLGGWQKLTPPNSEPFYVYMDTIGDVLINVSQQQLPANFKDSPDSKTAELAKGYNATQTFDAADTKVYIGTSAKGPQSVIFTKNDLLILIKSQGAVETDAWVSYIKSLS